MQLDPQCAWADVQAIRKSSPLVHNITNYVVMESTANGLLAIGASPIIAHALDEVDCIVKIANSLVLNIGTLSPVWIQGMMMALKSANSKGIPVILDPVGAGATSYRTETAHSILNQGAVQAIRGNASEIASLSGIQTLTKVLLVGYGADVNARDREGKTALHYVVRDWWGSGRQSHESPTWYLDVIEALIQVSVGVNEKDSQGNTALALAGNSEDVRNLLLRRRAK